MSDNVMTIREAVEDLWVDGMGDYKRGKENGFTVYDIAVMVTGKDDPDPDGLRKVQVGILMELKRLRLLDAGILCGGINYRPTLYIIAGSDEEENELIKRQMKYASSSLISLDQRLVNSQQPTIKAMISVIEGMVKGLNSLAIEFKGQEIEG